jgi:hypothetical protein
MAVPTSGEIPGLGTVKEAVDPMLEWAPPWVHDAIWAVLVFTLALVALSVAVHVVVPWVGRTLPGLVDGLLNLLGMVLVLPEYVATTILHRARWRVPNAMFDYGDAVQAVVTTSQRVSRSSLGAMTRLDRVSRKHLGLALIVLFVAWNGLYCSGRGDRCQTPTSAWADSVSAWFESDR